MSDFQEVFEKEIRRFFNERPALSVYMIEKEAELGEGTLSKFIKGTRKFPAKRLKDLIPILQKYGFDLDHQGAS